MRLWCSSSTAPSHGVDPGAIPGRRIRFAGAPVTEFTEFTGCTHCSCSRMRQYTYTRTRTKQKMKRANRGSNPGHLAVPWCRKRALYPLSYTRIKLRHPGVEPGSARPQRAVLTTKLMARYLQWYGQVCIGHSSGMHALLSDHNVQTVTVGSELLTCA